MINFLNLIRYKNLVIIILLNSLIKYCIINEYVNDFLFSDIMFIIYQIGFISIVAAGYVINGIGIFILFSVQDWQNWSFELANNMIYQIAAFAWLIFGMLLVWFSIGDYRESKSG